MWNVIVVPEFDREILQGAPEFRRELYAHASILEIVGPAAKRPHVDTLKGSKHANMKELRFTAMGGVWRVAFAFDPERNAVLLVAGDKAGTSETKFYKRLIAKADRRFDTHLQRIGVQRNH